VIYIPKKINVMGQDYKIIANKNLIETLGRYGQCDFKNKEITYDSSLTAVELLHTLIHEIDHALKAETGTYQAVNSDVLEMCAENTATLFTRLFNISFKKKS